MLRIFDNRIGNFWGFAYPLLEAVGAKREDYQALSTSSNRTADGMKISSVDMFCNGKLVARLQPVHAQQLFVVTVSYNGETWFSTNGGFTCMRSSVVPLTAEEVALLPEFGENAVVAEVSPII